MAAKQARKTTTDDGGSAERPQLASFLFLVGSILSVLLLGAALRTESTESGPIEFESDPGLIESGEAPVVAPGETTDPQGILAPESTLDRMARRAADDVGRLAGDPAGWTTQVGLFCDPERVDQLLRAFGEEPAMLVLPSYHGERPCFRICWNRYRTREAAADADDMPATLRSLLEGDPYPRLVTEVLE